MSQQFHGRGPDEGTRPAVPELPKLQLPTFSLRGGAARQTTPHTPPSRPAAPQHYSTAARPQLQMQRQQFAQPAAPPTVPQVAPAQVASYQAPPQQHLRPAHEVSPPMPVPATPARSVHHVARPSFTPALAGVSPSGVAVASPTDSLLARITPVHMGIAMTVVVFLMILANGSSGGIRKVAPAALPVPATVVGGGTSQTLPMKRKNQGMMSPAAAEAILAERNGRRVAGGGSSGEQPMKGMPSPAASKRLNGETLPMRRPNAANTIPPPGGGDAHAVDTHYRGQTLPMARPIEHPVMTPGQAAAAAQAQVNLQAVDPGAAPIDPNGAF